MVHQRELYIVQKSNFTDSKTQSIYSGPHYRHQTINKASTIYCWGMFIILEHTCCHTVEVFTHHVLLLPVHGTDAHWLPLELYMPFLHQSYPAKTHFPMTGNMWTLYSRLGILTFQSLFILILYFVYLTILSVAQSQYQMLVNTELGRTWKETLWPNLRHYCSICQKGLWKTTTNMTIRTADSQVEI